MSDVKIAIGFSGGGFRAAGFNLGVLTYLNEVPLNGRPLLQNVVALSTVSGGTITGARYAIGIKNAESLAEIYYSLDTFLSKDDLIKLCLERLSEPQGWDNKRVKSLINAFADIYDKHLFNYEKFGKLLSNDRPIHLRHMSFNATEFAHALQFRFQVSEKIVNPEPGEPDKGIIGNSYFRVDEKFASKIRMADILAASSCFPAAFEPINFPTDFVFSDKKNAADMLQKQSGLPVGLMDGGIVDNQGVESLLLANERMKRNRNAKTNCLSPDNLIDLIILSDVASPYMQEYVASVQKKKWWKLSTPADIIVINSVLLVCFLVMLRHSYIQGQLFFTGLFSAFTTLSVAMFIIGRIIKDLPSTFQVPKEFVQPMSKLLRLKLYVYENLIVNRKNSVLKLTMDVFLKHVRRLNYKRIYEDVYWKNRRIMNAIYELRIGEKKLLDKIKSGEIQKKLQPSVAIQQVAKDAAGMGTTLWFTKEELDNKMLDKLIACGQFTMCWNLLEYIGKIKIDTTNTTQAHQDLITCESELLKHWEFFNNDPFWLIKEKYSKQADVVNSTARTP